MAKNLPRLGDGERVLNTTLGCKAGDIFERVIITPFIPLKAFRRHFDEGDFKELTPQFFFKGFSGRYKGVGITVLNTGVGPSRVGDCISFLSLAGVKEILFTGAVGALRSDWQIGDLFLPLTAADGEGYTRYVTTPFKKLMDDAVRIECSGGLEDALGVSLEKSGLTVREGSLFTIGSIAFESPENLKLLANAGYDAIEMEISAFYAAGAHHGIASAALTYVSDLPLASSLWDEKSDGERSALKDAYHKLPELAVEFFSQRASG